MTADVGYYDQSYPPSIYAPPPVPATGATAGTPGSWTPPGSSAPTDAAQAGAWGVVASPATAWTSGQYVQGTTVGAAGRMSWSGSAWVGGAAPLAAKAKAAEDST